ncbi:glycoprotein-N-acetylgalactosamine 3-beta-galactosyltransferase 1-like [Argonauta hians]
MLNAMMFRRVHTVLYVVLGISIGFTISMLSSSMHSFSWSKLSLQRYNVRLDSSDHNLIFRHQEVDENHEPHDDSHVHHDDYTMADTLKKKVRVLCWIMTGPKTLNTKAIHVKHTWGRRCNKILFMSSVTDPKFPTVGLNISEGREHLTGKTMKAFSYIYKNYFNDYDWFMKADDDTYVIVENLRYFLSAKDPKQPIYFGHHFKTIVKGGYHSGGAGYVLSKEALRRFALKGNSKICRQDGGAEDAEIGRCLMLLNVTAGQSVDSLGRSRFHCFDPGTHLHGGFPKWFYQYDSNGAKSGIHNISDYAITFHYVSPRDMHALEFYVYHLRPFGIVSGVQNLNI